MIGQRVESRPGLPWAAVVFFVVGLSLAGAAVATGGTGFAIAAVVPLALGATLLAFGFEQSFAATFTEEGIAVDNALDVVPYTSLQNVWAGGRCPDPGDFRKRTCAIDVLHDHLWLHIPPRLNVPSHEVYAFLAGRVTVNGSRYVNPVLAEYLERQERYFGPANVWTFRAATRRVPRTTRRSLRAFAVGLIAGGAIWIALGFSGVAGTEWGAWGILAALVGALLLAISFTEGWTGHQLVKNWRQASLVIGPQGMAMIQGDIQGEIHWPELLDIRFGTRRRSFVLTREQAMFGIILRVKGADIVIADLYDRPLYIIYDRILTCSGRVAPEQIEL